MSQPIHIKFTRFSAFYSPLIATIAGGFLVKEGFATTHSVCGPGESPQSGVVDGSVQVAQWAPAQAFPPLERGEQPPVVHFAQINERDGFFVVGRRAEPDFSWRGLIDKTVLVDHALQPLTMFKHGCRSNGVDPAAIAIVDAGQLTMEDAFRSGRGDYIVLQGPAPQQIEHDGAGKVVAAVGESFGPIAFSSLVARRDWLEGGDAARFMKAYRAARDWVIDSDAAAIAEAEQPFFPGIATAALARSIHVYQRLGCWSRPVEISRPAFEVLLDVYQQAGLITRRHHYEDVVGTKTFPESAK